MKRSWIIAACFIRLLACVSLSVSVGAQETQVIQTETLVTPLQGGGFVQFTTETVLTDSRNGSANLPEQQLVITPRAVLDDDHVIHRALVDKEGVFIFGYDLRVEPVAQAKQFKVSAGPLDPAFGQQLRARDSRHAGPPGAAFDISTLSKPAATQIVEDGDRFALDLLVNPKTGVKIVDVIRVSFNDPRPRKAPAVDVPTRDFTLQNVELAMSDHQLVINDQLVTATKSARGCRGALVWFYLPDHGRFIFSLSPHGGYDFKKVGVIEHNKISFTSQGNRYEWTSIDPVVGSGGNWHLWVLHDADYKPDFYPPAENPLGRGAESPKSDNAKPRLSALDEALRRAKGRRQAEYKAPFPSPQSREASRHAPRRIRISTGSADRMENLLPKK